MTMKTLKETLNVSEALFSKKNIGKNALYMKPYDFFKDIDENFERTGPFVVKLISKSKQIEDRILFICEAKVVTITKILNTFQQLKVKFTTDISYSIERAKDSGYFIVIFSNAVKIGLHIYLPPITTVKRGIDNYTFGDYRYIINPEDSEELKDIYNNFIKPNLNS